MNLYINNSKYSLADVYDMHNQTMVTAFDEKGQLVSIYVIDLSKILSEDSQVIYDPFNFILRPPLTKVAVPENFLSPANIDPSELAGARDQRELQEAYLEEIKSQVDLYKKMQAY